MHISAPPKPLKHTFNLRKQKQVFDQVYAPLEDVLLPAVVLKPEDYYAAHEKAYVDGVLRQVLANGFGDYDPEILAHAVASVGSMYAAALAALTHKVAFAPVSGFHHAGWDFGGGFCTFNGLLIAAMKLRAGGLLPQGVLIIDADGHYGNGTEDIVDRLKLDWVTCCGLDYGSVSAEAEHCAKSVAYYMAKREYSLILYQAGADSHKADPASSGYLSDLEWDARDRQVFGTANRLKTPIVWNLAGGYNGNKTLTLHNRTFAAALQVYQPQSVRLHTHTQSEAPV